MIILVAVQIIVRFVQEVRILVEIQKHIRVLAAHVLQALPLQEAVTPVLIQEAAEVHQPAIQV